jgi:lipopolysaccharide export system protein LptA
MTITRFVALAGALLVSAPLWTPAASAQVGAGKERAVGFGNFGASKEPIKIDADRLDVFDKEGRAVFAGNVVAVQGESTMNCTQMTVFYEQNRQGGQAPATPGPQGADDSSIKKIDCQGPVTIVSKTQVATGNNATFDRISNKIFLTGNAALSDGPNVTRGERVVYDINTGVANVETKPGGRVRALFVPGSGGPAPTGAGNAKPAAGKPATN